MTKCVGSVLMGIMLVGTTLAGCKEDAEVTTRSATPAASTPQDTGGQVAAKPTTATADVDAVLDGYERIRAALAQDELTNLRSAVVDFQQAAGAAAEKAPAALGNHLRAAASAAESMSSSSEEAAATRKAFGEVSRAVVALLGADSKLAEGRYLFECPMASGYKKWVQTNEEISNPYMGKAMPACGAAAQW